MIIGVDGGALSITDQRLRVGVWRVTYFLLKELAKIDKGNEYRLYTFLPIDREVMRAFGPRMKNVVVRPAFAWSTIQLPIELRRHPADVFLGLSQMLPYSTSRNIGFIYDLGFLRYPHAYPGSFKKLTNQTKQLAGRADHIIAISEVTKEDIIREYMRGIPKQVRCDKLTVAYPGVDARFRATGVKHKETHPYFLFVGALKRGKNVPYALKVFKTFLTQSRKTYDFIIVGGDFWEDPEIRSLITELGLTQRVKLPGFVSDRELPSYYRGAEALLVTSLWEGFCLPAVEAMASGCPVVYVNHGSLPEIVGTAGVMFEDEARGSMALTKLTTNAEYRGKMAALGVVRARMFRWKKFAQSVYDIIVHDEPISS